MSHSAPAIYEIVIDTETTGIDPLSGHRVVEIGAVELVDHAPTGRTFHCYLNPERSMPADALAVHGLSGEFLGDKPLFGAVADEFLAFVSDAPLVAHNAGFDIAFLNAELKRAAKPPIATERVVGTLVRARRQHAGGLTLDDLCARYGVDRSRRTQHGALLDAELLAAVYVELTCVRQSALQLEPIAVAPVIQLPIGVGAKSRSALARGPKLPTKFDPSFGSKQSILSVTGVGASPWEDRSRSLFALRDGLGPIEHFQGDSRWSAAVFLGCQFGAATGFEENKYYCESQNNDREYCALKHIVCLGVGPSVSLRGDVRVCAWIRGARRTLFGCLRD
jgi:DNA polymerase III subunit epsilon